MITVCCPFLHTDVLKSRIVYLGQHHTTSLERSGDDDFWLIARRLPHPCQESVVEDFCPVCREKKKTCGPTRRGGLENKSNEIILFDHQGGLSPIPTNSMVFCSTHPELVTVG